MEKGDRRTAKRGEQRAKRKKENGDYRPETGKWKQ